MARIGATEKQCEACGGWFVVGGRGNPMHRQRMCSIECQRAARYRHGRHARELSVAAAAYLAGIIDGKGSVMIVRRRDTIALRVSVSNTSRRLLEWIVEVAGIGKVRHQYPEGQQNNLDTIKSRPTFQWYANGDAADSVLQQIRPYMVVKDRQADLAIATMARLRVPATKADRSWQEETYQQMRTLNRGSATYDTTASPGG